MRDSKLSPGALRTSHNELTGPTLWLGGLEAGPYLKSFDRWIER